ncbi:hypothetical protein IJH72_01645 [Candidatus Saccharibacteria bacterium]|nr:hypothetical protein [Candidatus Saccharibacteria bacterium]MBR0372627.1 hypothetical protein [Candidatus Saccharibacteria bacterium]
MFNSLMRKFVKFIDPKLEKYREKPPEKKYSPKTLEEFIDVLRRTPKTILSTKDRERISAIMSFDDRKVKDLMVEKEKMVFVNAKDVLGPLVLDKLYKSGFTNFPVVDNHEKVKGVIHTEALNTLEIKKTDRAEKYLDKNVSYLHTNDSLKFVVKEIERTNSYYFLVLNEKNSLAGFFTIQMLLDYLLG